MTAASKKDESTSEWALTFAERQMATEQGMNPGSVAYNINLTFQIEGSPDVKRLSAALNEVMNRHRILKSNYPMRNGEYVRKINSVEEH